MSHSPHQHRFIEPLQSAHAHLQSFVYAYNPKNTSGSSNADLYILLSLWAEPEDLRKIFTHLVAVFKDTFYHSTIQDSTEELYKQAIHKLNREVIELDLYYKKHSHKFQVEGAVVIIREDLMLVSGNGAAQIYRTTKEKVTPLLHTSEPTKSSTFRKVIGGKLKPGEKILLTSSRFSDNVPNDLLKTYLSSNEPAAFEKLTKAVRSLESNQLAIIEVALDPQVEEVHDQKKSDEDTKKNQKNVDKITTKVTNNRVFIRILNGFKNFWNTLWSKYINQNPLVAILVVVVIFALCIGLYGYFNWFNPRTQQLKKTYSSIENSLAQAKTEANSGQKQTATQDLDNAAKTISQLSQKDIQNINQFAKGEKKPTIDQLNTQITTLRDSLLSIKRLNPNTIYSGPEKAEYTLCAQLGDNVYFIDQSNGDVLSASINSTSNSAKVIGNSADLKSVRSLTASPSTNSLFALTKNGVLQIKPSDSSVQKQTTSSGSWPDGQAIGMYVQSLYLLSPADNQIYRYARSGNGFGAKTSYLKKPSDSNLSDATSLAINGSVFVAKRDGEILLFDQGNKKDFAVSAAPTDLNDIVQISYVASPETLYLLNDQKSAIIQLALSDSQAQYVQEFIINKTDQIAAFAYDSKTKTVYFATGNTLQKAQLE